MDLVICSMLKPFINGVVDFLILLCEKHQIAITLEYSNEEVCSVIFPSLLVKIVFHSIDELESGFEKLDPAHPDIKHVHLWEDQWIFHKDKIESKIQSLLGITQRIHGRETIVKAIDNLQLLDFLAKNHLNVPIKAKNKFGLYYKNELVAVMSFSNGRPLYREDILFNSFEMLRFCSKLGTTVVGGFSKLLNHFIKKIKPDDIMTYVDADWSDGKSFLKRGFELIERMPNMEFWLNSSSGIREYPQVVIKDYGISMDLVDSTEEKELFLKDIGYKKVFNSGSYKFILLIK